MELLPESCSIAGFCTSGTEPSGSAIRELINLWYVSLGRRSR
jgi:hypothetical protein